MDFGLYEEICEEFDLEEADVLSTFLDQVNLEGWDHHDHHHRTRATEELQHFQADGDAAAGGESATRRAFQGDESCCRPSPSDTCELELGQALECADVLFDDCETFQAYVTLHQMDGLLEEQGHAEVPLVAVAMGATSSSGPTLLHNDVGGAYMVSAETLCEGYETDGDAVAGGESAPRRAFLGDESCCRPSPCDTSELDLGHALGCADVLFGDCETFQAYVTSHQMDGLLEEQGHAEVPLGAVAMGASSSSGPPLLHYDVGDECMLSSEALCEGYETDEALAFPAYAAAAALDSTMEVCTDAGFEVRHDGAQGPCEDALRAVVPEAHISRFVELEAAFAQLLRLVDEPLLKPPHYGLEARIRDLSDGVVMPMPMAGELDHPAGPGAGRRRGSQAAGSQPASGTTVRKRVRPALPMPNAGEVDPPAGPGAGRRRGSQAASSQPASGTNGKERLHAAPGSGRVSGTISALDIAVAKARREYELAVLKLERDQKEYDQAHTELVRKCDASDYADKQLEAAAAKSRALRRAHTAGLASR